MRRLWTPVLLAGVLISFGVMAEETSSVDLTKFVPDQSQPAPDQRKNTRPSTTDESSSLDLTKIMQDQSQRPSDKQKIKKPSAHPFVGNKFTYSRFTKIFPYEVYNNLEKLEAAANKLAEEIATDSRYKSTCGDFDKPEARKPKMCDVPSRVCHIPVGSERCHFVQPVAPCPAGSIAPFSPHYESRGFKVCMKQSPSQNQAPNSLGTGQNGGYR